ncbi:heterokaryon incompatibility protein-domain-containing protein [Boeremia exigua]|uniref:heterokaryon incompatibility protein-domain-containing protein n=1 Tax=Boeremia exigua TaxID=749465 RepID=UPI001E8E1C9E|nr:heterokaryon incompatibility protein-domain-containing protein [Boeremia exigua]KAH6616264.1 heterokaryon incompatibility protein-domain-containing protein [Boeremia exigua]
MFLALLKMADGVLCDLCLKMVFGKLDMWTGMREIRTYDDLEQSASVFSCPFCKAFMRELLDKSLSKRLDILVFVARRELYSPTGVRGSPRVVQTRVMIERQPKILPEDEMIGPWFIGYAHRNNQEEWSNFHRDPNWQSHRMDLDNRFEIIDRWLAECTQGVDSHTMCCDITSIGYPTRLLDLRGVETAGYITLVETEGWSKPSPEYTTLSHCWGHTDGPRPLETTSENLEAHKRQIQIQDLPRTFQDAVRITLRLGKALLWIDSLCIVQHDKKDWETEANKMGVIYENSFLTIAAISAENCEGGCSIEPWTWSTIEGKVPNGFKDHGNRSLSDADYIIKLRPSWEQWKENYYPPLLRRGWVLQEMCLSRRVLYMAAGEMLWQCRGGLDHENVDLHPHWHHYCKQYLGFVDIIPHRGDDRATVWCSIAQNYSRMNFTHVSDKLPALAGILEYYTSRHIQEQPLLGLWRKSIAYGLAWIKTTRKADDRINGLPTWTWLSSRSQIEIHPPKVHLVRALELDSWSIEWERQPYVSKLLAGTLNVSSKIIQFKLHNNVYEADIARENFLEAYAGCPLRIMVEFDSDVKSTIIEGQDVVLSYLLLGFDDCSWLKLYFLALLPAPDDPSKYIRMGCGYTYFDKPEEDEMTPELVEFLGDSKDCFNNQATMDYFLRDWKDASLTLC